LEEDFSRSLLKKEIRKKIRFYLILCETRVFLKRLGKAEQHPQDDDRMNPLLPGRESREVSSDEL
jgi:hypothetical protein